VNEHPTLTVCWKVEDGHKVELFKEIFDRGPVGNDFKRAGVLGPVHKIMKRKNGKYILQTKPSFCCLFACPS
jgi:hypothetical protein